MSRWLEAARITAYAVVLQVAALGLGLPLFVGWDSVGRHLGFASLLVADGTLCVLVVALLGLRHGPIDTARRGARLGLWAAAGFYGVIFLVIGVIPAVAGLASGDLAEVAGYLATIAWIIAIGSYGLPIVVGAGGGALYGWHVGRRARI